MTGEAEAVARSERPATVSSLVGDLQRLGVTGGMVLMVHTSLSALGWVAGGAQAMVEALRQAVGSDGTLVMPTHAGLTNPARWQNPPVPEAWWSVIRAETPPYDPALTPTRNMGAVVECFRHHPGVRRSAHPVGSGVVGAGTGRLMPQRAAVDFAVRWMESHRR